MRWLTPTGANIVFPSINKDMCVGTNMESERERELKEKIPFEDLTREILIESKACIGPSHQGKEESTQDLQGKIANGYTLVHVIDNCVASIPLSMSCSLLTCKSNDSLTIVDDVHVV